MVVKDRGTLPGEWAAVLAKVALAVKALIEGIEETAIEDLIEALEEVELMAEEDSVGLVEMRRYLYDDGALFELPEGIEDAVGDHHYIGLVFIFTLVSFIGLLFTGLMHIAQHLQGGGTGCHLQVAKNTGFLLCQVTQQPLKK